MSILEDAKIYVDLPKNMQNDDALRFARAVITLYDLLDTARARSASPVAFSSCCGKWQVGQSGPCVLDPNHDGSCLGRTGTAMGG